MATETGTTLDGLFKQVYVDGVKHVVPKSTKLQQLIKFDNQNRIGRSYEVAVMLQRPSSGTRALGATALTAFALRTPRAGLVSRASLASAVYLDRSQLPYFTEFRTDNARAAFEKDTRIVVDALKASVLFNKEIDLLYGSTNIGTLESNTYVSGATTTIKVTLATWSQLLWAQMVNAPVDVYNGASKRNANGDLTVTSVNPSTREIVLTADSGNAADVNALAANDVIVPAGGYGASMSGLDAVATNTGTLYGINGATYESWRGNTASMGDTYATIFKIGNGLLKSSTRTFEGEWEVICNPYTFEDMIDDQAALRRFGESTKTEIEQGTESLKFYGAAGSVNFTPYALVKSGEAFGFRKEHCKRIGATEFMFAPIEGNGQDARYTMPLANNAGYEFRAGWDEAFFCDWPASCVKFTNIVNQSQTIS